MPDASGDPNLAEAERVPLTSAGRLTVAGFPASLGATVALAVLTYRFLEAPFRRQRLASQLDALAVEAPSGVEPLYAALQAAA